METFSTLLAPMCGEFTGPGEFLVQGPVTRSFDVLFDLHRNKRLSKQPWGWWFKTPSWSLWRQCNEQKCSPYLDLHVFIYIYAYRSICYISICICICVIFILFYWFHYLCPRRTWSLVLYFGKQYCTKMLHCYLFPCSLFWQLSIVK